MAHDIVANTITITTTTSEHIQRFYIVIAVNNKSIYYIDKMRIQPTMGPRLDDICLHDNNNESSREHGLAIKQD